jgi:uncharacterized protein YnzC (UPF0291/DUF896 family)
VPGKSLFFLNEDQGVLSSYNPKIACGFYAAGFLSIFSRCKGSVLDNPIGEWQSKISLITHNRRNTLMEETVKRINELARKAKASGLTDEELEERNELRKKYIESFRANMRDQLQHIKYVGDEKE